MKTQWREKLSLAEEKTLLKIWLLAPVKREKIKAALKEKGYLNNKGELSPTGWIRAEQLAREAGLYVP